MVTDAAFSRCHVNCTFGLESAAGGVCELITTVIVHCLALGREGGIFKLERASLERFPAVPHSGQAAPVPSYCKRLSHFSVCLL